MSPGELAAIKTMFRARVATNPYPCPFAELGFETLTTPESRARCVAREGLPDAVTIGHRRWADEAHPALTHGDRMLRRARAEAHTQLDILETAISAAEEAARAKPPGVWSRLTRQEHPRAAADAEVLRRVDDFAMTFHPLNALSLNNGLIVTTFAAKVALMDMQPHLKSRVHDIIEEHREASASLDARGKEVMQRFASLALPEPSGTGPGAAL